MLRDVFYYGKKPNVHPREKFATDLIDARNQAVTDHFWIVNEFCDYTNFDWDFDFEFLPDEDVWAENHNNVWPSQHQKDSGTWLCPKEHSDIIVYRADVDPIRRKNELSENWVLLENIDKTKFDFSWHPDPTDPPYIYKWGCKFFPVQLQACLEYHTPNAEEIKYMETIVEVLPKKDCIKIYQPIDDSKWDLSWRPDPREPAYIYVWGNKYIPGEIQSTLEFHASGATEKKYMPELIEVLPQMDNWQILEDIDMTMFDFKWRPNPTSPPYIYVWGNQWNRPEDKISVQYVVEGATEYSYMEDRSKKMPTRENWVIPENLDVSTFDFSWEPHPNDPPYIYQFGTQWQKTDGPRYVVKDAVEVKYMDFQTAKALPNMKNWLIPKNVDVSVFDFSWHPDSTSPPYIYHFPTQWAITGGPVYICEGASEVRYQDKPTAIALPDRTNWEIPDDIDDNAFDFSWHPYAEDDPYIYQFGTQWQKTGGPRYVTPGVISSSPIKYIDTRIIKAKKLPSVKNWTILNNLKIAEFDYSWHPDETEEPYVYVFGNNHQSAEQLPTLEYKVEGASQTKYVHDAVAILAQDRVSNWQVPSDIDDSKFDFSWKPSAFDPTPCIYQFGTQWQKTGGPRYVTPGTEENQIIKYIDTNVIKAIKLPSTENWIIPKGITESNFDFSWHPDDTSPPYVYQFGTQWSSTGGPIYKVEGASEVKYIEGVFAKVGKNLSNWIIPEDIEVDSFDFSWYPEEGTEPAIYQFGTQWQKTGGPRYVVPGAESTNIKYIDAKLIHATKLPSMKNWVIPEGVDVSTFDFSWHPDDNAAKCSYQFGTEEHAMDGPKYVTPGSGSRIVYLRRTIKEVKAAATNQFNKYYIETTLEDLINKHPNEVFWALNPDLDYSSFNFNWSPDSDKVQFTQAFGTKTNLNTQTYLVNAPMWNMGFTDINYVEDVFDAKTVIDMFFVDKGNPESKERFERLQSAFGKRIQKTRYLNSWVDTINRCINRSSTNLCWILNSELDYTGFDFNYYPNPWQMKMVHVFGTQWSHWGTTFMVNRETFANDTKYIKIIEHLSNLNFVKTIKATATTCLYDVYVISHGNMEISQVVSVLKEKCSTVTVIDYRNNYYDTLKDLLAILPEKKEHYIWICSSICDYTGFDFTYICDPFAREQLHVFPSNKQKYGDTFLLNVNKLRDLIPSMTDLGQYEKINFNQRQRVNRFEPPVVVTKETHLSNIDIHFDFPYAIFKTSDNESLTYIDDEPMSLWKDEAKTIKSFSTGNTIISLPQEAKTYVKKELYDYPYIIKSNTLKKSLPLDIIFLSNGEKSADENFDHLKKLTDGLGNRLVRVDGVNGRVQAYHAAAQASETPWLLTVFAKLKVNHKFDWNWQPDRLQMPKHYVFYATNPVNGLEYGHQAMIAYNKKLVLANTGKGLDFTMDDEHEIVELNSGVAMFNTDPFSTWRTAFREVIKLRVEDSEIGNLRMEKWLTGSNGEFGEYSIKGAKDALDYYTEVNGDLSKLKLSYEWNWLKEYFVRKN